MDASRILPDLQCSLLCEDVRQEINGNFMLAGVVGILRVPQVPITHLRLFVFNRWTAGVGQFVENVRLLAPDGTTVVKQGQARFALQDASHHMTNVTMLAQVPFSQAGVYAIEVLVEDVMKLRYPLPVVVVPPPQRPGTPPPPAGPPVGAAPPAPAV
jgi:hypothetical protein